MQRARTASQARFRRRSRPARFRGHGRLELGGRRSCMRGRSVARQRARTYSAERTMGERNPASCVGRGMRAGRWPRRAIARPGAAARRSRRLVVDHRKEPHEAHIRDRRGGGRRRRAGGGLDRAARSTAARARTRRLSPSHRPRRPGWPPRRAGRFRRRRSTVTRRPASSSSPTLRRRPSRRRSSRRRRSRRSARSARASSSTVAATSSPTTTSSRARRTSASGSRRGSTYAASIVGADPTTDIAVIRVMAPPSALHPLALADSAKVVVGDAVFGIGNPFGLERTMTAGIVSATRSRHRGAERADHRRARSRPTPRSTTATPAARSSIASAT